VTSNLAQLKAAQIKEKRSELESEYIVGRRAAIGRGEADPHPQQPRDYSGLFLSSLAIPNDPASRAGRIVCVSFEWASRMIVGRNLYLEARVATTEEIAAFWREQETRRAEGLKAEDVINSKRTVVVRAAEPKARAKSE